MADVMDKEAVELRVMAGTPASDRGSLTLAGGAEPITEQAIAELVDRFYTKVRLDTELGPIFDRELDGAWGPHLATMRDFWSSIMLTSGRYKGNPVAVHRQVEGIDAKLFERWLALFAETCRELFDDATAGAFSGKAVRIAESLKLALFYRPDRTWPRKDLR